MTILECRCIAYMALRPEEPGVSCFMMELSLSPAILNISSEVCLMFWVVSLGNVRVLEKLVNATTRVVL